jgi:hypothetical protein
LQFQPEPVDVGRALGGDASIGRQLGECARAVATALRKTEEWSNLGKATSSLSAAAREDLKRVRLRLKDRLAPAAVDDYEPNLALRRDAFRQEMIRAAIEELTGAALNYAVTFESVDRLIETAASDVFGQLAAFREPTMLGDQGDIDFIPGTPQRVSFEYEGDPWPSPGMLIWLDDELASDAIQIESHQYNFSPATGGSHRIEGVLLAGTHAAWRADTR